MNGDLALHLVSDLLWTGFQVCLPLLGMTMLVGLVIAIIQVITQIQEMSLSFVPKLVAAIIATIIFGPWMLRKLTVFAATLWNDIPSMV